MYYEFVDDYWVRVWSAFSEFGVSHKGALYTLKYVQWHTL